MKFVSVWSMNFQKFLINYEYFSYVSGISLINLSNQARELGRGQEWEIPKSHLCPHLANREKNRHSLPHFSSNRRFPILSLHKPRPYRSTLISNNYKMMFKFYHKVVKNLDQMSTIVDMILGIMIMLHLQSMTPMQSSLRFFFQKFRVHLIMFLFLVSYFLIISDLFNNCF